MEQSLNLRVFDSAEKLIPALAVELVSYMTQVIDEKGEFSLALSGGKTPKSLYCQLSESHLKAPWEKVNFYFGDERFVPPANPASNFKMANDSLFVPLGIKPQNIFRVPTEYNDPELAASGYERVLRAQFIEQRPHFDLVLLGMGSDGHTASLFPGSAALNESEKWVRVSESPNEPKHRITLTFPAINAASRIIFLVTGKNKAGAFRCVKSADAPTSACPAKGINPINGDLQWWVDRDAASLVI